jgi:oligoribonuclease NrnB/cAMP/cGMP phosphodiesterase (DHH superfamily)
MEKSGVGLTWEYFFPDEPIPPHLDMVQDRDLWKFKLPNTQNFVAGLFFESDCLENIEQKLTLYDEMLNNPTKVEKIIELGSLLNLHKQIKIKHIVKKISNNKYTFNGYSVICYNTPGIELTSDLGNALSSEYCDLAVLWSYDHFSEEYHYSLRSTNKVNCANLARDMLNGGGHPNAAGGRHKLHPSVLFNKPVENADNYLL